MSYIIKWELNSVNELNSLPLDITERILGKLEEVKDNPYHYLEKLKGMPEFKIRVGDYRIIVLLERSNKTIKIQSIGHRKNIYKKYRD